MIPRPRLLVSTAFSLVKKQFRSCHAENVAKTSSSDRPHFPGSRSQWTEKLDFLKSEQSAGIPVYRVMNRDGKVIDPSHDPGMGEEKTVKIYKGKCKLDSNTVC
jgi:hypothetical protein